MLVVSVLILATPDPNPTNFYDTVSFPVSATRAGRPWAGEVQNASGAGAGRRSAGQVQEHCDGPSSDWMVMVMVMTI
jgi:hypothetical protein